MNSFYCCYYCKGKVVREALECIVGNEPRSHPGAVQSVESREKVNSLLVLILILLSPRGGGGG